MQEEKLWIYNKFNLIISINKEKLIDNRIDQSKVLLWVV